VVTAFHWPKILCRCRLYRHHHKNNNPFAELRLLPIKQEAPLPQRAQCARHA